MRVPPKTIFGLRLAWPQYNFESKGLVKAMQPKELTLAMKLLADFEKDFRKVQGLESALSYLDSVIEGENEEKYIIKAKNILTSHKIKIISKINEFLSNFTSLTLQEVDLFKDIIRIFLKYSSEDNDALNSLGNELEIISIRRHSDLTPGDIKEPFERFLKFFNK
jgi:hypothetical protein